MSRTFSFHPAARDEFRQAVAYYEDARAGLGAESSTELRVAIESVLAHPRSGFPAEAGTPRKLLARFPYSLIYLLKGSHLKVIAVMHHRRSPGYWLSRAPEGDP